QIRRRTADYPENLASGGFLFGTFLSLVEQPRVFNNDDGLGRKRPKQPDLPLRKKVKLSVTDGHKAHCDALPKHRDGKLCPVTKPDCIGLRSCEIIGGR